MIIAHMHDLLDSHVAQCSHHERGITNHETWIVSGEADGARSLIYYRPTITMHILMPLRCLVSIVPVGKGRIIKYM